MTVNLNTYKKALAVLSDEDMTKVMRKFATHMGVVKSDGDFAAAMEGDSKTCVRYMWSFDEGDLVEWLPTLNKFLGIEAAEAAPARRTTRGTVEAAPARRARASAPEKTERESRYGAAADTAVQVYIDGDAEKILAALGVVRKIVVDGKTPIIDRWQYKLYADKDGVVIRDMVASNLHRATKFLVDRLANENPALLKKFVVEPVKKNATLDERLLAHAHCVETKSGIRIAASAE